MIIKEVIVVEGKSDTNKIKQAVQADTIETNGAALSKSTIQVIKHALEKRGVIVFTDPDFAGNKIRQTIDREVPGCKHAFLSRAKAQAKGSGKSLGVEHASIEEIRKSLAKVYEIDSSKQAQSTITRADLLKFRLIGTVDARKNRERLGEQLCIGYTNAKQLLSRLHMFQISIDELKQAMKRILEGGNNDV